MGVCLGVKATLLLSTMDSQLEPVWQDTRDVQGQIVTYKQKLAAAKQAGNKEEENSLSDLLRSLQEEENILLRSQAPSKPCLQLYIPTYVCSQHVAQHVPFSSASPVACL